MDNHADNNFMDFYYTMHRHSFEHESSCLYDDMKMFSIVGLKSIQHNILGNVNI